MADREKVIKGLEVCLAADLTKDENPCAPCPYFFDGMCQNTMKKDALELLREQEPVSVGFTNGVYHCGNCGEPLFDNNIYCFKCGRKVEWGDDGDG